ncbi:response regulator transcription factor [Aggregatilinea lenta]|uniref:response regulator transcription factor n=1 Tax=Aggregatilinea lenta TaxID=913108 RepID=UPI000E5A23DC|nr:response regulator [Aggregatilinea lenta]
MTGRLIAVIDDEPAMVDMLTTFLRLKGYDVRGAYTGLDGLSLVQTERPAALLLDLMLPDIDGFEVCRRLRAQPEFAALPVIMISAHNDPANSAQAREAGANLYMPKPVRFPDLLVALEDLMGAD